MPVEVWEKARQMPLIMQWGVRSSLPWMVMYDRQRGPAAGAVSPDGTVLLVASREGVSAVLPSGTAVWLYSCAHCMLQAVTNCNHAMAAARCADVQDTPRLHSRRSPRSVSEHTRTIEIDGQKDFWLGTAWGDARTILV